jgi:hypothetical protein
LKTNAVIFYNYVSQAKFGPKIRPSLKQLFGRIFVGNLRLARWHPFDLVADAKRNLTGDGERFLKTKPQIIKKKISS